MFHFYRLFTIAVKIKAKNNNSQLHIKGTFCVVADLYMHCKDRYTGWRVLSMSHIWIERTTQS